MLICQNAEGVHRRRKVRNPCGTVLVFSYLQTQLKKIC